MVLISKCVLTKCYEIHILRRNPLQLHPTIFLNSNGMFVIFQTNLVKVYLFCNNYISHISVGGIMLQGIFLTFPIAFFDKKVHNVSAVKNFSRFQVTITLIHVSPLIELLKLT